jgi:hypothetical protein
MEQKLNLVLLNMSTISVSSHKILHPAMQVHQEHRAGWLVATGTCTYIPCGFHCAVDLPADEA